MALQLEAPETIRLVEDLSRRSGEDVETVVRVALQERHVRLRTPEEEAKRRARVYELVRDLQAHARAHPEAIMDLGGFLHGEEGLPK